MNAICNNTGCNKKNQKKCSINIDDSVEKTSQDEFDKENRHAICTAEFFLKALVTSICNLFHLIDEMIPELYHLENELNFRNVDKQYIEEYNKLIMYMYENINNILSRKIAAVSGMDTLIINQPNDSERVYDHRLELVTILPGPQYVTNYLGSISNMSISKINDQITFQRAGFKYVFLIFPLSTEMTNAQFREYLDASLQKIREIEGLLYNDVISLKKTFKTFMRIVMQTIKNSMNEHLKDSKCGCNKMEKKINKWRRMIEQTKCTLKLIKEYIENLDFVMRER